MVILIYCTVCSVVYFSFIPRYITYVTLRYIFDKVKYKFRRQRLCLKWYWCISVFCRKWFLCYWVSCFYRKTENPVLKGLWHTKVLWQPSDLWKKHVASRRSLEKTGLCIFTCFSFWGADRRRKIGGPTVPVAAASQIVISRWQTAHH
jgi:hypothetical protein